MLGWKKHKLESRLPGEISITSELQMTTPLWQKVYPLASVSNRVLYSPISYYNESKECLEVMKTIIYILR